MSARRPLSEWEKRERARKRRKAEDRRFAERLAQEMSRIWAGVNSRPAPDFDLSANERSAWCRLTGVLHAYAHEHGISVPPLFNGDEGYTPTTSEAAS